MFTAELKTLLDGVLIAEMHTYFRGVSGEEIPGRVALRQNLLGSSDVDIGPNHTTSCVKHG